LLKLFVMLCKYGERVIQVLQEKGLLCQNPTELAAGAQPLTIEELDQLAVRVAEGGPLSELIVQERRGEVYWRYTFLLPALWPSVMYVNKAAAGCAKSQPAQVAISSLSVRQYHVFLSS
jgi:hypothetical protein